MVRMKGEHPNFTKAETLSSWLFLKYDMTYKTFQGKSKKRRDALRAEYEEDTGRIPYGQLQYEYTNPQEGEKPAQA